MVFAALCFMAMLSSAFGSTPGAAAGLAMLLVPSLLAVLFSWQLWHWINHKPCGWGSAAPATGDANEVALSQSGGVGVELVSNPVTAQGMVANPGVVEAGSAAHAPVSRPIVAPAGAPDAPFLARCNDAGVALVAVLEAAIDDAQRAAMVARLGQKFQLRWDQAVTRRPSFGARMHSLIGDSGGASDAEVPASFDAAAKALLTLAMRYPASAVPLEQGAFAWDVPPLRTSGEAAVVHALRSWTDTTSEAADSALFSSMGPWISPFAARMLAMITLTFIFASSTRVINGNISIHPLNEYCNFLLTLGCAMATALLHVGRREAARWTCAVMFAVTAAGMVAEAALNGCKCWGPYAETHTEGGESATRDYPWQYSWYMGGCGLTFMSGVIVSTHPHRSFEILFLLFPTLSTLAVAPMAYTDHQLFKSGVANIAGLCACMYNIGAFLWLGRAHALTEARHLAAEDAVRYTRLWEQELLPSEGFREALLSLEGAWRAVQAGALLLPKHQLSAPTLYTLFAQADELNDLLQAKLFDVCAAHGGKHHACGVKTEQRALQKVFRSYKGDWRRLGDLCRTSLVFDDIASLEACLRAIGTDAELQVVHASDVKMRLREGFDAAALSGGYRDIQLCVRLDSDEARKRRVHEHLCEVQLHFAQIIALKSGGGHKNYVLRRNLGGK
jgi:hypothetical protein